MQVFYGGPHLLGAFLGHPSNLIFHQLQAEAELAQLDALADGFESAAGFMGPPELANMLQTGGVPVGAYFPPPPWGTGPVDQYAQPRRFDLGRPRGFFDRLFGISRRRGAKLERALHRSPFLRAQFEMYMGGRLIPDGRNDGRMTIQPFSPGYFPAGGGGNMAAAHAMSAVNQFAGGQPNGYMQTVNHGLGQLGSRGSRGADYGVGGGILGNPALTVEDQVALLLMKIMKEMDEKIQQQAKKVEQIQQQGADAIGGNSSSGGSSGSGSSSRSSGSSSRSSGSSSRSSRSGGGSSNRSNGQNDNAPSIDVETMKLKRMVDKRSQMFDMLRQIIDKYNQTAKNMIDSIGR